MYFVTDVLNLEANCFHCILANPSLLCLIAMTSHNFHSKIQMHILIKYVTVVTETALCQKARTLFISLQTLFILLRQSLLKQTNVTAWIVLVLYHLLTW